MRRIYKISLVINSIMLMFTLLIATSYLRYLKSNVSETSLVMVEDGLSVNYLNGNNINVDNDKNIISITNNSIETLYYYIKATDINKGKEEIKFRLLEKNNNVKTVEEIFPEKEDYLVSYVEIAPGITHTYELSLINDSKEFLNANIKVGLEDAKEEIFSSVILKNNEIKKSPLTKIGEEVATTDEGLIEVSNDIGKSYYFRGSVTNNYVNFGGLLWRIVRINEDGSIKLILNDYISEKSNYYNTDDIRSIEEKLDYSKSNIENTLSTWYQNNLNGYEKYLSTSKFCVDDSVGSSDGVNTYYLGYSRLLTDYNQELNCLGKEYNTKIGLLSADEAVFAGASKNASNTNYYLYNVGKDTSWWTLTPSSNDGTNINYFEIDINGTLKNESTGTYYRGIRPVINLIKKTNVSGVGSLENPYIIKE